MTLPATGLARRAPWHAAYTMAQFKAALLAQMR